MPGRMCVPTEVLAPTLTSPAMPLENSDKYRSKLSDLLRTSLAKSRNSRPASVRSSGRFERSISFIPSSFSSCATWVLIADCDFPNFSAAWLKPPIEANLNKTRERCRGKFHLKNR